MAAQGQDPEPIIKLAVSVIKDLENGLTVEDAVANAYAAQKAEQQQEQAAQAAQQPPGMSGGSAPSDGLPPGVAPGQRVGGGRLRHRSTRPAPGHRGWIAPQIGTIWYL